MHLYNVASVPLKSFSIKYSGLKQLYLIPSISQVHIYHCLHSGPVGLLNEVSSPTGPTLTINGDNNEIAILTEM